MLHFWSVVLINKVKISGKGLFGKGENIASNLSLNTHSQPFRKVV